MSHLAQATNLAVDGSTFRPSLMMLKYGKFDEKGHVEQTMPAGFHSPSGMADLLIAPRILLLYKNSVWWVGAIRAEAPFGLRQDDMQRMRQAPFSPCCLSRRLFGTLMIVLRDDAKTLYIFFALLVLLERRQGSLAAVGVSRPDGALLLGWTRRLGRGMIRPG